MRAMVVSDDAALASQLREALQSAGLDCPASCLLPLKDAESQINSGRAGQEAADLFFVVLKPDAEQALATVRGLRRRSPHPIFAVGPATDTKLVLRTIREGAREYLDQAELAGELSAALQRLKIESAGQRSNGRIIACLPASGGCGGSTLSASLASALAKLSGGALLIDLNAEFGNLASLLDLKPSHTLADLCQSGGRLDRSLLEGVLAPHQGGVRLLSSPLRIDDAALVSVEAVRRVLSLASEVAPWVVVDLPHAFRPEVLPALSVADAIVLVMRLDFTSLHNTRRIREHLQDHGIGMERIEIVVNRYRQPGELPPAEAEAALGTTITHYVNDDPKTVNRANNNGVPVILYAPAAKVSQQIAEVARRLKERIATV